MKTTAAIFLLIPLAFSSQAKIDTVKTIKTVEIQGKKPLIKRKIDRLEFNIDKTPLQNLNAWEILKNTPGIQMQNETLSVQNSTQILVTINDKKTLMTAEQLHQYLENMDGNNVAAVEVITSPPAKYEAQGSAVINIKLKQDKSEGYKGRISARWHQAQYAKGRIGLQQSFNTNKWQLSGNYDFVSGNYVRKNLDVTVFDKAKQRWESDLVRKTEGHEQHIYNFVAQYNLDSLQSVQFGFNGFNAPRSIGYYRVPTVIYNTATNLAESNFLTANDGAEYTNNFSSYLIFDKKFGKNNLTFSNNFSTKRYHENQDISTFLHFQNKPESSTRFANQSVQDLKLYSSQLDYRRDAEKFVLESGLKFSSVVNKNSQNFFEGDPLVFSEDKSNDFKYNESIFAAYISGEYKWEKWETKAGLRSETTAIKTESTNPFNQNKSVKTGIFPSFYLLYKIKDNQQLSFSYSKRIDRPSYNFMNPSKSYYNLYSYFQGDAGLKSTIIHNFSLNYSIKDYNFEFYHKFTKDPSMEISIQNPDTFETIYHFTNIEKGWNWGANFSKNFTLKPNWRLNVFAMGDYNSDFFIGTDNVLHQNKNFFYNASVSTQITLDKAKTWDMSASYTYNSKSIQGNFTISPSQRTNLIINHKMFDKKLDLGLVFNDIFHTDHNVVSTDYADQHQYFKDFRETQYFMLNLKYNFGNQKVKDAKSAKKTEEQNRM